MTKVFFNTVCVVSSLLYLSMYFYRIIRSERIFARFEAPRALPSGSREGGFVDGEEL